MPPPTIDGDALGETDREWLLLDPAADAGDTAAATAASACSGSAPIDSWLLRPASLWLSSKSSFRFRAADACLSWSVPYNHSVA